MTTDHEMRMYALDLFEILKAVDHTLALHGHIDSGTPLHQRIIAALRSKDMTEATTKFIVGRTYSCRSAVDWESIYTWKIVARTAKQLTLSDRGNEFRRGIKVWDNGVEWCQPLGSYSMCPVITADREGVPI